MTDPHVAPPAALVIGTDPDAVRRAFRGSIIGSGVAAGIVFAIAIMIGVLTASTSNVGIGALSALPFLLVGAYLAWLTVRTSRLAATRADAGTVLTLDTDGLMSRLPQGELALPWDAIRSIEVTTRGRHRILIVRLEQGVTPESAGVRSMLSAADFRVLATKGFRLGSVGIDVPVETIAAAAAAFTAGRLVAP